MEKLFIDTNVVIDFFLEREPYSEDATLLFELRSQGKVEFYLSALTLANLAYLAQRSKRDPFGIISVFLNWVNIVDLRKDIFLQTLSSRFDDFEDGLQYFSALQVKGINAIITRIKKILLALNFPFILPQNL